MLDRTLNCFFGSQFDEGADADRSWVAIKVYRDGNPIELARFDNQDDAEDFALAERDQELADHSQFGMGA